MPPRLPDAGRAVMMKPCHLLTFFGTIVYLDASTSSLRHGRIGTVADNVTITGDGDSWILMLTTEGRAEPIGDLGPGGCRFMPGDKSPCRLQIKSHYRVGTHTLDWSGRLLTAEADGSISLFRDTAGDWEAFFLMEADELAELTFILQNCWIQRAPLRVFDQSEMALGNGFELHVGDVRLDLAEMLRVIRVQAHSRPSVALEFVATYHRWKLLSLRLFRPLVYLVAYGRDEILACADIAIRSLRAVGGGGAALRGASGTMSAQDVRLVAVQAHDTLDFALTRYKAVELPEFRQYQPVLYIDTDVVCNAPLDGLFHELCFSDAVHALSEGPVFHDADFYGKTLFEQDPCVARADELGISTGILGFRNVGCVAVPFKAILDGSYGFARGAMQRDYFPAFDQPFANYVFRKWFSAIRPLEGRAVVNLYIDDPSVRPEDRLGLIHFAGGVGNASPKIERMRVYLEMITQGEAAHAATDEGSGATSVET